jgi:hypothetical protein
MPKRTLYRGKKLPLVIKKKLTLQEIDVLLGGPFHALPLEKRQKLLALRRSLSRQQGG